MSETKRKGENYQRNLGRRNSQCKGLEAAKFLAVFEEQKRQYDKYRDHSGEWEKTRSVKQPGQVLYDVATILKIYLLL